MSVGTVSVGFIVTPLAFVDVSVSMNKFSKAVSLVSLPLSLVLGAVGPHLMPVAVLHPVEPLTGVNCTAWESHGWQRLSLRSAILIIHVLLFIHRHLLIIRLRVHLVIHLSLHFPWLTHSSPSVTLTCISLLVLCSPSSPIITHHIYALLQCRPHRI